MTRPRTADDTVEWVDAEYQVLLPILTDHYRALRKARRCGSPRVTVEHVSLTAATALAHYFVVHRETIGPATEVAGLADLAGLVIVDATQSELGIPEQKRQPMIRWQEDTTAEYRALRPSISAAFRADMAWYLEPLEARYVQHGLSHTDGPMDLPHCLGLAAATAIGVFIGIHRRAFADPLLPSAGAAYTLMAAVREDLAGIPQTSSPEGS
jgi:hypothetical protein